MNKFQSVPKPYNETKKSSGCLRISGISNSVVGFNCNFNNNKFQLRFQSIDSVNNSNVSFFKYHCLAFSFAAYTPRVYIILFSKTFTMFPKNITLLTSTRLAIRDDAWFLLQCFVRTSLVLTYAT